MAFRDLDEFLEVEPLVLPIRGKEYAFPGAISARTWLKLNQLGPTINQAITAERDGEQFDPNTEALSDEDEGELLAELCGDAMQEMVDDGLTSVHFKAVLATLLIYHLTDREKAEAVWNAQATQGEAPAPNRKARRKSPAKATRPRGSHDELSAPIAETDTPGEIPSTTGT